MNNLDLCTQVLFKKYANEFPWLNYVDLNRIIAKFADDPIHTIDNHNELTVHTVKEFIQKCFQSYKKLNK